MGGSTMVSDSGLRLLDDVGKLTKIVMKKQT